MAEGRGYALMGIDTGAGASPSFEVGAVASAAVVSLEAKILAIEVSYAQAVSAEVDIGPHPGDTDGSGLSILA